MVKPLTCNIEIDNASRGSSSISIGSNRESLKADVIAYSLKLKKCLALHTNFQWFQWVAGLLAEFFGRDK